MSSTTNLKNTKSNTMKIKKGGLYMDKWMARNLDTQYDDGTFEGREVSKVLMNKLGELTHHIQDISISSHPALEDKVIYIFKLNGSVSISPKICISLRPYLFSIKSEKDCLTLALMISKKTK